nr:hypothetical protein [Tolivirales sp.]
MPLPMFTHLITSADIKGTTMGLLGLVAIAPLMQLALTHYVRPWVVLQWRSLLDRLQFSDADRIVTRTLLRNVNEYFSDDGTDAEIVEKDVLGFDGEELPSEPVEAVGIKPNVIRRKHEFRMYIVARIKAKCGGTPKRSTAMVKAVSEMAVKFMEEHNHRAAHIVRDLPHIRMMVFMATRDETETYRLREQLDVVLNSEALGPPESPHHH